MENKLKCKIIISVQYMFLFLAINLVLISLNLYLRSSVVIDNKTIFDQENLKLYAANVCLLLFYLYFFYMLLVKKLSEAIGLLIIYIQCLIIPMSFILNFFEVLLYIVCGLNVLMAVYYIKMKFWRIKNNIVFLILNIIYIILFSLNIYNTWFLIIGIILSNIYHIFFIWNLIKKCNILEKKIGLIFYIINLTFPYILYILAIMLSNSIVHK